MRAIALVWLAAAACFEPTFHPDLPCDDGWCPPPQQCGADKVCHGAPPGGGDAGNGDGSPTTCSTLTYERSLQTPASTDPYSLTAVNLRGTGTIDLAVGSTDPGAGQTVSILLGSGSGAFQAPVKYVAAAQLYGMASGDFDADGHQDVAALSNTGTLAVLLGDGTGKISTSPLDQSVGVRPNEVASGDFDGDGHTDLAITDGDTNLSVMTNFNGATFASSPYAFTADPSHVAAGDVTGDHIDDIVAVMQTGQYVVLVGQPNGPPTLRTPVGTLNGPTALAIGDVNGDGKQDLVVGVSDASAMNNSIVLLLGNGDGSFGTATTIGSSGFIQPSGIAVLPDRDATGTAIIAVVAGGLLVISNGSQTSYMAGSSPRSLAIGDFNRDGHTDIAVTNTADGTVSVFLATCVP